MAVIGFNETQFRDLDGLLGELKQQTGVGGPKTGVEALTEVIESMGGTTSATTIVEAIEDLGELLGPDALQQYVEGWLDDHGATAGYEVDENGYLQITLT